MVIESFGCKNQVAGSRDIDALHALLLSDVGSVLQFVRMIKKGVVAGTEVHVTGKRGFITGGKVCATVSISVKNLGSQMGADTIVEVGVDATVKQAVAALQKEIAELNKSLSTIKPVLEGAKQKLQAGVKMLPDQLAQIQKLATVSKNSSARLAECMQELEQYQSVLDADTQGQVIVTGDVTPVQRSA